LGSLLLYGALSSNYGGFCCSIRWFVPFLAVGYYTLAVVVRTESTYKAGLILFSGLGAPLAFLEWLHGPWLEPAREDPGADWFLVVEMVGLAIWPLWFGWSWWKRRTA
jgi:hypothetical protein